MEVVHFELEILPWLQESASIFLTYVLANTRRARPAKYSSHPKRQLFPLTVEFSIPNIPYSFAKDSTNTTTICAQRPQPRRPSQIFYLSYFPPVHLLWPMASWRQCPLAPLTPPLGRNSDAHRAQRAALVQNRGSL